eukprot:338453-Pleurochrysis_carterae.AAC.1
MEWDLRTMLWHVMSAPRAARDAAVEAANELGGSERARLLEELLHVLSVRKAAREALRAGTALRKGTRPDAVKVNDEAWQQLSCKRRRSADGHGAASACEAGDWDK